ncbi:hypothetical protein [Nocardiopsis suaedae]|uniref:DNA primase n=1 Tax=Nocardiopsis suaedae TaxID=3018444 RepID=A0ABT4TS96_9ACTN|nr:hypothetical protein [Nocardiopsis suaedae]MDA2807139.1 hypothetical protein [Nocardiopsis suaedae]
MSERPLSLLRRLVAAGGIASVVLLSGAAACDNSGDGAENTGQEESQEGDEMSEDMEEGDSMEDEGMEGEGMEDGEESGGSMDEEMEGEEGGMQDEEMGDEEMQEDEG